MMHDLKKNAQAMYYATFDKEDTIYKRDKDGDIVYTEIDGVQVPVEAGKAPRYNDPIEFKANFSMSSGEGEERAFGVAVTDYEAVIVTNQKDLPIDELTLIWKEHEPEYGSDGVKADSADYSVIGVRTTLNTVRYLLKKVQKHDKD